MCLLQQAGKPLWWLCPWAGCVVPMVPSHTSRYGWTLHLQNRFAGGFSQPWQSSVSYCIQMPPSKWLKSSWRYRRDQPGCPLRQPSRGSPVRLCSYIPKIPWTASGDPFGARVLFHGRNAWLSSSCLILTPFFISSPTGRSQLCWRCNFWICLVKWTSEPTAALCFPLLLFSFMYFCQHECRRDVPKGSALLVSKGQWQVSPKKVAWMQSNRVSLLVYYTDEVP